MNLKHVKRIFPFTLKSIWFMLLLNLVALSLFYITYNALDYLVVHVLKHESARLIILTQFTLAPLYVLFKVAPKHGWRGRNFPALFTLTAISTISFFALIGFLIQMFTRN